MAGKRVHILRFFLVLLLLLGGGGICAAHVPADRARQSASYLSKYSPLAAGDHGEQVLALEERLGEWGFDPGYADGIYDAYTVLAVSAFQKNVSLPQTGAADALTQYALFQEEIPDELSDAASAILQYSPLAIGSQDEGVRALEERLAELGYLTRPAADLYDADTAGAVSAFQREAGLEETGVAGSLTQYTLFQSETSAAQPRATAHVSQYPPLGAGDHGESVLALEKRLDELGFDPGWVDGIYDAYTVLAVSAFQRAASLPETGAAGSLTQFALYQDSAPSATAAPSATPRPEPSAAPSVEAVYIGNKNSRKFHVPTCSSVDKMDEDNKVPLSSREEALAAGYVPCKRCNP